MKIDWVLLKRSVLSDISEEERNLLNAWLDESSEHREFYREIKTFLCSPESFRPTEERIRRFKASYEVRLTVAERRKRRHRMVRIGGEVAASCILSVGMACFLWWQVTSSVKEPLLTENRPTATILPGTQKAILVTGEGKTVNLNPETADVEIGEGVKAKNSNHGLIYSDTLTAGIEDTENQLIVPRGGEYAIVLSDGTRVWLNSASELKYPVHFAGDMRRVYLKGEAYFQVAHDRQKAFIVVTDDIEVKVYGTEFNINTRVADYVQTTLVRGAVSIKTERSAEKMLKPGQLAQFDRLTGETEIKNVDVSNYIGWKSGVYIFEDKSIEQIMDELSLWYDIEVFFRNNTSRNRHFSGSLPRYREIDDMLKVIEKTSHVRFEVKGKTIIVD